MRAFSTFALVGSFALSLVSGVFAAPTAGSLVNVGDVVVKDVANDADVNVLPILSKIDKRCDACDAHGSDLLNVLADVDVKVEVQVGLLRE
jgi:hypothetical protein